MVASFNDGKAYRVHRGQIDEIKQRAQTLSGIELDTMDISLHCGAYGSSLVFNLVSADQGICVWSGFNGNSLVFKDIGILGQGQKGLCDGMKPGSLIFIYENEMSIEEVREGLSGLSFESPIQEIRRLSKRIFKVVLKSSEAYKVLALKEKFESEGIHNLKTIEGEQIYHPVGDYQILEWP